MLTSGLPSSTDTSSSRIAWPPTPSSSNSTTFIPYTRSLKRSQKTIGMFVAGSWKVEMETTGGVVSEKHARRVGGLMTVRRTEPHSTSTSPDSTTTQLLRTVGFKASSVPNASRTVTFTSPSSVLWREDETDHQVSEEGRDYQCRGRASRSYQKTSYVLSRGGEKK